MIYFTEEHFWRYIFASEIFSTFFLFNESRYGFIFYKKHFRIICSSLGQRR